MNEKSITAQTEKLRWEINEIQLEEKQYRLQPIHSQPEKGEHAKRKFRLIAIREKLKTLVQKFR